MATRMFDRRLAAPPGGSAERVAAVVARHGELLTRVAKSYSLCADDAQDAVQRALEIYLRRVESLDPATELAWLKVVVKHEALAVRRGRSGVAGEEVDLDAVPAPGARSVQERLEATERVERSAEIMRRLKRDEARALMLKAQGLSYVEIGERLGWTYTKVNRCITEGRRRFMKLYEELETGAECERLAPVLVSLAAGEASSEALLEIRPHLRNCAACRATVRQLHASRLGRALALLPLGALVEPFRGALERIGRGKAPAHTTNLHPMEQAEKLDEAFRSLDATQPVAEGVSRWSSARINVRGWVETALQRLQSSDVAMGVHAATTTGGGRIGALAALIGVCVSGVGAGTYCVATALLPDEKPTLRAEAKPHVHRPKPTPHPERTPAPSDPTSVRLARVRTVATPSPTAAPTPPPRSSRRPARRAPAPDEFSFEKQATTSTSPTTAGSGSASNTASTADSSFESGTSSKPSREFDAGSGGEFSP